MPLYYLVPDIVAKVQVMLPKGMFVAKLQVVMSTGMSFAKGQVLIQKGVNGYLRKYTASSCCYVL